LAVKETGALEGSAPKRRSEPRGRLPAYYGEVIDNQQREKIYDIQSRILSQITDLQQRIAQLEQQRDTEVSGVLTTEQMAKVKELTEAAKAKRSENAKRRKPSPASAGSAESATAANVPAAKP
jgi:TolA-binding protein